MAELDIRQLESNIYGNVEDSEALPLFVRYTSDDAKFHGNDAQVSFEDTIAQLSGTHNCLVHTLVRLSIVDKKEETKCMKNLQ